MSLSSTWYDVSMFWDLSTWNLDGFLGVYPVGSTCVALPTKKTKIGAKLCRNTDLEPPLPLQYNRTIFRSSAIIPASQLVRNRATLRWGLRCSHYSVDKRQQDW